MQSLKKLTFHVPFPRKLLVDVLKNRARVNQRNIRDTGNCGSNERES